MSGFATNRRTLCLLQNLARREQERELERQVFRRFSVSISQFSSIALCRAKQREVERAREREERLKLKTQQELASITPQVLFVVVLSFQASFSVRLSEHNRFDA